MQRTISQFIIALLLLPLSATVCAAGSSKSGAVALPAWHTRVVSPANLRLTDVTIYYRPGNNWYTFDDWGHIFIYVRNDETGQSAYFDYYPENGYSVLGRVDQARIDVHASLTIVTTAQQEQAILSGILSKQQNLPDWKLRVVTALFGKGSTCVTVSKELLERGGLRFDGREPEGVWESAWFKYSDDYLTWKEKTNGKGSQKSRYEPGPGYKSPQAGKEYGRDPGHQARRVDPKAINNQTMYFKNGKRVK